MAIMAEFLWIFCAFMVFSLLIAFDKPAQAGCPRSGENFFFKVRELSGNFAFSAKIQGNAREF